MNGHLRTEQFERMSRERARLGKHTPTILSWVLVGVLIVALVINQNPFLTRPSLKSIPQSPKNAILFYDDYPKRGDPKFQITPDIVTPLVAYVDSRGVTKDWFFDGFIIYNLYLYYEFLPSEEYIRAWTSYLFNGSQIANLDNSVGKLATSLGHDYILNVYLTVPVAYPNASKSITPDYGLLVNSDAIISNINSLITAWKSLNPQHLRLVGFYWGFTESVAYDSVWSLIPLVANYLHASGYRLLMIPYRGDQTVMTIHRLGVDDVTGQVNYAFDPSSNLTDFATLNNQLDAGNIDGIEFETPFNVKCCGGSWIVNLKTYYDQGYKYQWYKNRINTYYYGPSISELASNSTVEYRSAYDTIYKFVVASRTPQSTFTQLASPLSPERHSSATVNSAGSNDGTLLMINSIAASYTHATIQATSTELILMGIGSSRKGLG